MTSHGLPSHGWRNTLKRLIDPALRPLIENQRVGCEGSGTFGKSTRASVALVGLVGAARQAMQPGRAGRGLPRRGGHPPIQGQAFSHRSDFWHVPEAGVGKGGGVRTNATRRGEGSGLGGDLRP